MWRQFRWWWSSAPVLDQCLFALAAGAVTAFTLLAPFAFYWGLT